MGVIHKLNEDVVNAIIKEKQTNPGISCRRLADKISEQYNLKISKSSISTILKKASLNSSVGRRALEKQSPKKFKIPSDKKKQIFDDLKLQKDLKSEIKKTADIPSKKTRVPTQKPSEDKVLSSQIKVHKTEVNLKQSSRDFSVDLYPSMGLIFLKAAEWELANFSICGQMMREHLNNYLPPNFLVDHSLSFSDEGSNIPSRTQEDSFDSVIETMFFASILDLFSEGRVAALGKNAVWKLHGFKKVPGMEKLLGWASNVSISKHFFKNYIDQNKYLFTKVNRLKVYLQNKQEFVLDANMLSLWSEDVPKGLTWPLNKSMEMLSKCLLVNTKSLIFSSNPQAKNLSQEFYVAMRVFEDFSENVMTKISVLDDQNHEISAFSAIPQKKRKFILNIWPEQDEFKRILTKVDDQKRRVFEAPFIDGKVYFLETKTQFIFDGSSLNLRAIVLWDAQAKDPTRILLTNRNDLNVGDIILEYLTRWPNLRDYFFGDQKNSKKEAFFAKFKDFNDISQENLSLSDVFKIFSTELKNYCQKRFFLSLKFNKDINHFFSSTYDIPGTLEEHESCTKILLAPPKAYPYLQDLNIAVDQVNNGYIFDNFGRKIHILVKN